MKHRMKWLTGALISGVLMIGCGQQIEEEPLSAAPTEEIGTSSANLTVSCSAGYHLVTQCYGNWGYVKCLKFDVFKNYRELKCTGMTHCVDLGTSITCKYN